MRWLACALAAALVAGSAVACSGRDSTTAATATPDPMASAPPPVSATAASTAFATADPVLERTVYQPGDTLPADNGVGFMDPTTGELELWTAAPGVTIPFLQPTRDGALIVSQVGADEWYVTERATAKNWRLQSGLSPHIGFGYGSVLGAFTNINNGKLVLLDFATGTATDVGYTRPNLMNYSVASSADGKTMVIGDGNIFVLIDLPTAAVSRIPGSYGLLRARELDYDAGFVLAPSLPATGESFAFDWAGAPIPGPVDDLSGLSPDGKLRVREKSLGRIALAQGLGELPLLDYFIVERVSDGVLLGRMLGATFAGWSADSQRLLIHERGNEPAIITVDGEHVADAPWWPEVAKGFAWFSPFDPALVATNHGVFNTETGGRLEYTPAPGGYVITQWAPGNGTLILRSGPIPGKGGGSGRQVFEPKWAAALSDEPRLVVAAGPDCLNLREGPSVTTSPLRCLSTGTVIALSATDVETLPAGAVNPVVGLREKPESTWLHVATPDGLTGWVDAAYLEWAP